MIATFAEAVRATGQPCTFLLLAPTLLTVAALRATWWSVAAVFAAAIVGGWLAAVNVFVLDGRWLQASGVAAGAAVAYAGVSSVTHRVAPPTPRAGAAIAGAVTLLASMWWRPCVGREFGRLLTAAQTEPVAQLPGLTVYMVGIMLPVLAVPLAWRALTPPPRAAQVASVAAAVAVCVIAAAVMIGRHGDVVVTLTRWTASIP